MQWALMRALWSCWSRPDARPAPVDLTPAAQAPHWKRECGGSRVGEAIATQQPANEEGELRRSRCGLKRSSHWRRATLSVMDTPGTLGAPEHSGGSGGSGYHPPNTGYPEHGTPNTVPRTPGGLAPLRRLVLPTLSSQAFPMAGQASMVGSPQSLALRTMVLYLTTLRPRINLGSCVRRRITADVSGC